MQLRRVQCCPFTVSRRFIVGVARRFHNATPSRARSLKVAKAVVLEDIYQKKTPIEHVLLRPGMYIGSTEAVLTDTWVFDSTARRMILSKIRYHPGLLKIFDEILARDSSMSRMDVSIIKGFDESRPATISIWNNGRGIPVQIHQKEQLYVPELVLGQLLTGSSFADAVGSVTGGRHGYGAKLTNIFSREFRVETADTHTRKLYRQTWRNNMSECARPVISDLADEVMHDYTHIVFVPDLSKFHMEYVLDDGTLALMRRRVVDVAGVLAGSVQVVLDGTAVGLASFEDYARLYSPITAQTPPPSSPQDFDAVSVGEAAALLSNVASVKLGRRWDVTVGSAGVPIAVDNAVDDRRLDLDGYNAPYCVSFVNSMNTSRGGSHVQAVMDQLVKQLSTAIAKKAADVGHVPAATIRNHLRLFVNARVEEPSFDSQSKEQLVTPVARLNLPALPDRFIKQVVDDLQLGPIVIASLRAKARQELARNIRKAVRSPENKIKSIPKLEDANFAGTKSGHKCTLILTEGDSAKALAVAGLAVVGRDLYGVFPLRGKLLNVRDVDAATALENVEVAAIASILGLDFTKTYESLTAADRGLRYGRVMIMADQDVDGSHIKGLLINLFHRFWPKLLHQPANSTESFLEQFITPVLKAYKGPVTREFYSTREFNKWRAELGEAAGGWRVKYYKGLGTSTSAEARAYFSDLNRHRKQFVWGGESDDARIDLAFAKDKASGRKGWILNYAPSDSWASASAMTFSDFVDKELIEFSRADLIRSIPSVVDGLKPSQRKVLFACFKRGATTASSGAEVKVAQLAGYVAEHTAYHHGEASLVSTIVGMAQDYVGSNNIPLLDPLGQFGTRLQGGKDAASARYIFTRVADATRLLFPPDDDALLRRRDDDGQTVEPTVYVPIIPLVLVNGAQGIGTGWSTFVPQYHPLEVIDRVQAAIVGTPSSARLKPWWRGFTGVVSLSDDGLSCSTMGKAEWASPGTVKHLSGSRPKAKVEKGRPRGLATLTSRAGSATGRRPKPVARTSDDDVHPDMAGSGSETCVRISELPIGRWTEDYKAFLMGLVTKGSLRDVKEYHTESSAEFLVTLTPQGHKDLQDANGDLLTYFKLATSMSLRNMHLFDCAGAIKRHSSPEEILQDFIAVRHALYAARKLARQAELQFATLRAEAKQRFLEDVINGSIKIGNREKADVIQELHTKQYPPIDRTVTTVTTALPGDVADLLGQFASIINIEQLQHLIARTQPAVGNHALPGDYDFLLNMPIWRLTAGSLQQAKEEARKTRQELAVQLKLSPTDLWQQELEQLRLHLAHRDKGSV